MTNEKIGLTEKLHTLKRPTTGQLIWWGVGLVLAIALFVFVNNFTACWTLTSLTGSPLQTCPNKAGSGAITTTTNPEGTPVAGSTAVPTEMGAPQVELPPPWDGASRVTVLIIGLDYADWSADRSGPSRSDSMWVASIDPVSKTIGMVSVPRDMWVNIPGYGYHKINSAYYFGERDKLPGGGPGLAMRTVEGFLGIPIQYYAQIDFMTFVKAIDDIDGVAICLTEPIEISIINSYDKEILKADCPQTLNGIEALGFARNRHTANGDVDRSTRQQQVIMGIRDRVLDPRYFPKLVARAPALYNDLSSGIHTSLTLDQVLRLAVLAYKEIPRENWHSAVIDYTMMQDGVYTDDSGLQQAILRPYPDKIRELVDQVFGSGSMSPLASGDPTQLMQAEAAKVIVINGSGVAGMAAKTTDFLKGQGMNVVAYGNTTDYPDTYYSPFPDRTILIVHSGKPYAMAYLSALMQFNTSSQILVKFDPAAPADIILALGADWGNSNPMP